MLQQLQMAVIQLLGNIGQVHTVLVDFEISMHQAVRQIMPFARITGCNYHFGQALVKKMGDLGLKNYLPKPPDPAPGAPPNPEHPLRIWFGMVKSLALLPVQLIPLGWEMMQQRIPVLATAADDAKLRNFIAYFSNSWVGSRQFPIDVWSHWTSQHLRTTNHAEGYHHSLNANEIIEIRPALRNFLASLQKSHNSQQQHTRKLIAGAIQPKPRDPIYQNLHAQIETEKQNFSAATHNLWNFAQFDAMQLYMQDRNNYQHLCACIEQFLRYIRYRIGDKDNVNPQNP